MEFHFACFLLSLTSSFLIIGFPFQALRRFRRLCSEDTYTPSLSPLEDSSGGGGGGGGNDHRSPDTSAALAGPARYVSPFGNGQQQQPGRRPVTAEDVRQQQQRQQQQQQQQHQRRRASNTVAHFALGPRVKLPNTPDDAAEEDGDRFAIARKSNRSRQQQQQQQQQQPSVFELLARLTGETYI